MAAFDWRRYLEVAQHCFEQAGVSVDAEAAYRCAISRAYFAAFGYALRYAHDYLGFEPKKKAEDKSQDHGRLKKLYKDRRRMNAANLLGRLRDWRNACDYEDYLNEDDLPHMAAEALRLADFLITKVLPPPPNPKAPTSG